MEGNVFERELFLSLFEGTRGNEEKLFSVAAEAAAAAAATKKQRNETKQRYNVARVTVAFFGERETSTQFEYVFVFRFFFPFD